MSETILEQTKVFTFDSLNTDDARVFDMEEPTKELPLIGGRFAGREWNAETLAESEDKPKVDSKEQRRIDKRASYISLRLATIATVAAAMLMFSAIPKESETEVGMPEASARPVIIITAGDDEPKTLSVQPGEERLEGRATVINHRRGSEFSRVWYAVTDPAD